MKVFSQRSVLLFGTALAVCALAVPSMVSAASWSPVGTTHRVVLFNYGFTQTVPTQVGWSCLVVIQDQDVVSQTIMKVTSASYHGCSGTFAAAGCTVTATGTRFPWTMTAASTTNIAMDGVHVAVAFVNQPAGIACAVNGFTSTVTGNVTGGVWDPSATGANRRVTFNNASGLTSHSLLGSSAGVMTGQMSDTTATLNLFD
jgi:hypothetical protein